MNENADAQAIRYILSQNKALNCDRCGGSLLLSSVNIDFEVLVATGKTRVTFRCHENHHLGVRTIKTREINYAKELLGRQEELKLEWSGTP